MKYNILKNNIRDDVIFPIALYVVLVGLVIGFWWNISPSLSDMGEELEYSKTILTQGWLAPIDGFSSMSVVVRVFAPIVSQVINVSMEIVYKVLFPLIFSLTPVLLYYLYRKILPASKSFLAALFFVVLPPTFMGTAGIGKTAIAEPLAVGALLVIFSDWKYVKKVIIAGSLIILAIVSHYTIGAFLLVWLGIMLCVSRDNRKLYFTLLLIGIVSMVIYYYFVGNWLMFRQGWESLTVGTVPQRIDKVYDFISMGNFGGLSIIAKILQVLAYSTFVLIGVGIIYLIKHFQYIKQHREFFAVMFMCGVFIILSLFNERVAGVLYVDRWIQIGAFFLSILVGFSSYWISPKIIYSLMAVNTFYVLYFLH